MRADKRVRLAGTLVLRDRIEHLSTSPASQGDMKYQLKFGRNISRLPKCVGVQDDGSGGSGCD